MQIVHSADDAISQISPKQRIFVHGAVATPIELLHSLAARKNALKECELIHIHLEGELPYNTPGFTDSFQVANLFIGSNVRPLMNYQTIDYIPCFLSEMPRLFREKKRPIDVALIHVSPPDENGNCSLGTSVDIARAAVDTSSMVIAQINPHMPAVYGGSFVHVDTIDYAIETNTPLIEKKTPPTTSIEQAIGKHIASVIDDGATLQTGIGKIPNAAMEALKDHKHLGIHTEVWTDNLLPLIEKGVIDNSRKKLHKGKIVSSFLMGSKKLYEFIDKNPQVEQYDIAYTNSPQVIGINPNVVAINSAIEIDLTGQVCADSIGPRMISGVGGQVDYMRGAALSKNGKSIIAITSRTNQNKAKIVSSLTKGAGVVTTRADIHYVATEYGIVDLSGKTLSERARALISIAHPEDREQLEREWKQQHS